MAVRVDEARGNDVARRVDGLPALMVCLPWSFALVIAAIRPSLTPTLAISSRIVSGSMTRPLLMTRS